MPSPADRAHRAFLAVLAAMAILTGLIPSLLIPDHGLAATATVAYARPDEGEDDSSDDDDDDSDDTDDSDDADDDQVDEDALPDNVKAILKKNRKELRQARRELKEARRSAKPAAKPKPKPKDDDGDHADEPSEREVKATQKLQRANLISALSKSKHGLVDPAAAAKLAVQDGLADFNDDDEPVDVDDLVKDLLDEYAFLKGAKPKPKAPNVDSGDKKSQKAPTLTADELAAAKASGMTPEEYANYKSPQPKLPAKKKST